MFSLLYRAVPVSRYVKRVAKKETGAISRFHSQL